MTWFEIALIVLAGCAAGAVNTIVGAGTLVTFPTLVALGVPPVVANVSNSIGMIPGGLSGTWGYRRELHGQSGLLVRLAPASLLGAAYGAVLLLLLPQRVFGAVVPALLGVALLLILLEPSLSKRLHSGRPSAVDGKGRSAMLVFGVFGAGIYGGYFGAAQGVILIAFLSVMVVQELQRNNALKNGLSLIVNMTAAATYVLVSPHQIDWVVVSAVASGTLVGGVVGASIGRLLHPHVLRAFIGLIAVVGILQFVRS